MARTRITKRLAQRIDLNYFKRPTPLKRAKFWLSIVLPLFALIWIARLGLSGDHRVYSSGRMSKAHAVLERECAACHVRQAGGFSAKAADAACLDCHDGPMHHAGATKQLACSTCHTEHRGPIHIAAVSEHACAECHADLKTTGNSVLLAPQTRHIRSFESGHPEFSALLPVAGVAASDPGTIKLNHAIHMKPIRRGPNGPNVQLQCGNCHNATAVNADLTYADASYRAAAVSYRDEEEVRPLGPVTLRPPRPVTGHELMAPVRFANACAACHLLTFDKRFDKGVPHDKPEVVHAFLIREFQQYIAAHPGDVRVQREPGRDLSGKPLPPQVRVLTPAQWVAERTADAEELLWRKTCKQCHALGFRSTDSSRILPQSISGAVPAHPSTMSQVLPYVQQASITLLWMPHAKFDHDAHRGFACVSCHVKALTSTESGDILLPGIETCKTCHAPGPEHADSRCSECHTYHDWTKRKEVTPKFTLPALRAGGH